MTDKGVSVLLKVLIIAFGLIGLFICIAWYPFSISLTSVGPVEGTVTYAQSVECWVQIIFYWAVSAPCFAVLVICWIISDTIKRDDLFCGEVAKKFALSAKILAVDLAAYVIGNAVFAFLGWNDFLLVYVIIGLLGVIAAALLAIFSHYIKRASVLKEENEGTI